MKLKQVLWLFEAGHDQWIIDTWGESLLKAQAKKEKTKLSAGQVVDKLKEFDPSIKKGYIRFIAKAYINSSNFRFEDGYKMRNDLTLFDRVKQKLAKKDILQYQSWEELIAALKPFENFKSADQQEQIHKETGSETVIDQPNFKVISLHTKEAACHYGRGTRWCTAATKSDNKFDEYIVQGPIYVIIAGGKKFQFGLAQRMFTNSEDAPINEQEIKYLLQYPGYIAFLHRLIAEASTDIQRMLVKYVLTDENHRKLFGENKKVDSKTLYKQVVSDFNSNLKKEFIHFLNFASEEFYAQSGGRADPEDYLEWISRDIEDWISEKYPFLGKRGYESILDDFQNYINDESLNIIDKEFVRLEKIYGGDFR